MKDRLTHHYVLQHFDHPVTAVKCINDMNVLLINEPYSDELLGRMLQGKPNRYVAGTIVDRLCEYENTGYDPDELHDVLKEYKELKQKVQSTKATLNSIYGSGFRNGKVYPYAGCVDKDFIKEILKDGKHSVNILYKTDGVQVTTLPFNADEEDAE